MCILPKENKRKAMKLCCGMTQDQNSQSWVGSLCQEEKKKMIILIIAVVIVVIAAAAAEVIAVVTVRRRCRKW